MLFLCVCVWVGGWVGGGGLRAGLSQHDMTATSEV